MNIYNEKQIELIINSLNSGMCGFVSTDTINGLICKSKELIYKIKQRDFNKEIILFISKIEIINNLDKKQIMFLKEFWPGPITIIKDSISYRMPNVPLLLEILNKMEYLYCSSANISGKEVIKEYKDAIEIFNKYKKDIFIISNKCETINIPSTIINIDSWKIIREGANIEQVKIFLERK